MQPAAMVLAQLLASCAPGVGPHTMASIVAVESGGAPLAIHDNATKRSYFPRTVSQAVELASHLIDAGHSVDLGLAQINSENLSALGLSLVAAFDPCRNLARGASILRADYRRAGARYGRGEFALLRAIGAYNTGSIERGDDYIARVIARAGFRPGAQKIALFAVAPPRANVARRAKRMPAVGKSTRTATTTNPTTPEASPILIR